MDMVDHLDMVDRLRDMEDTIEDRRPLGMEIIIMDMIKDVEEEIQGQDMDVEMDEEMDEEEIEGIMEVVEEATTEAVEATIVVHRHLLGNVEITAVAADTMEEDRPMVEIGREGDHVVAVPNEGEEGIKEIFVYFRVALLFSWDRYWRSLLFCFPN